MNTSATQPPIAELRAPAAWRTVDFISDLHLQAAEPATFEAWQSYMLGTPADAVFILGDLFEVWVGDDAVDDPAHGFEAGCARVLQQCAARRALFFMHGNRDFLVGPRLMAQSGATLLDDPVALTFKGARWLLSHGDALCLDDVSYMAFRQQVRGAGWQQSFLSKPLAERQALARGLREQSRQQHEARKQSGQAYADLDTAATLQWLQAAHAPTLIHGHTHRPAVHDLGHGYRRVVLTDWDAGATPPRAEVLRLSADGIRRIALV